MTDFFAVLISSTIAVAVWYSFGAIGRSIGRRKNQPTTGFILGLFGPIGWLVVLLLPYLPPEDK